MGKSSSSSKKLKHSTDSSNKLRSVKKKKRKTKRNKSKKIRRLKDYSDESESSGSGSSLYTSSSEDDYRRKKKRRSNLSKKRSRKRFSSSESDDDDDNDYSGLLKKKKRSKRKDESVTKKKRLVSRKRRKRGLSSSSTSSEQSDDSSESDGKRKTMDKRRLGEVKDAQKRSRDELEGDSGEPDECWQVEDEFVTEKNPRRLKSIIVKSYSYGNDERKVEDDRDVYMTRGGNRELGLSEESDERVGEITISYARTRADDNGGKTVGYDESAGYNKSETSKVSHRENSMKDDDLEAILKSRALENLKRFRGVTQKSEMTRKEVSSSVSEGEPLQIESEKVEESQDHGLMKQKLCVSAGSKDLETSENILHVVNLKESGTALANCASQQDQEPGDTAKVKASSSISSCSTKRKLLRPLLGKESLNLASRKEDAGGQDAEAESINGSTIKKNCPESSLALAPNNEGENIEPTKVSSTLNAPSSSHADTETLDETKGGPQSEQKKIETKDESQYEQKTMTVMRGGEMVQVSYKVYIPKKTCSLGRRKLNR